MFGPRDVEDDPIASIPAEDFTSGVRIRMYSEQEIAHWVRNNRLIGKQKMEFLQALAEFNGAGPMTGIIRTALREMEGLPPIPGDEV
jgi:hypothetical protein